MRRRAHKHRAGTQPKVESRPAEGPVYILDRRATREVDRLAAKEFGVPTIVLMENAARHVADVALEWVEAFDRPRVLVVCGPGNNGGDGMAAARHLSNAGLEVEVAVVEGAEPQEGDAGVNAGVVRRMGIPVHALDASDPAGALRRIAEVRGGVHLVVDAVFGTGLDRAVGGAFAGVIAGINALGESGASVLAVDAPSGLDADSGAVLGAAVRADVTVTFVGLKPGFLTPPGRERVGDVVVADIGAPRGLVERLGRRVPPVGARKGPPRRRRKGK